MRLKKGIEMLKVYFSWESFFAELLGWAKNGTQAEYHKDKLADYYLEGKSRERIMRSIPDDMREGLK